MDALARFGHGTPLFFEESLWPLNVLFGLFQGPIRVVQAAFRMVAAEIRLESIKKMHVDGSFGSFHTLQLPDP